MDKKKQNIYKKNQNVKNSITYNKEQDENYDYDFVPSLNNWLNIDEQKQNAKRLQDID